MGNRDMTSLRKYDVVPTPEMDHHKELYKTDKLGFGEFVVGTEADHRTWMEDQRDKARQQELHRNRDMTVLQQHRVPDTASMRAHHEMYSNAMDHRRSPRKMAQKEDDHVHARADAQEVRHQDRNKEYDQNRDLTSLADREVIRGEKKSSKNLLPKKKYGGRRRERRHSWGTGT